MRTDTSDALIPAGHGSPVLWLLLELLGNTDKLVVDTLAVFLLVAHLGKLVGEVAWRPFQELGPLHADDSLPCLRRSHSDPAILCEEWLARMVPLTQLHEFLELLLNQAVAFREF